MAARSGRGSADGGRLVDRPVTGERRSAVLDAARPAGRPGARRSTSTGSPDAASSAGSGGASSAEVAGAVALRREVIVRLRAELPEIVTTIAERIRARLPVDLEGTDAEYANGLAAAIAAALEWALAGLESERDAQGPIPEVLIEQAERAARAGVTVETVLQRYVLGHQVLGEFLREEAADVPIGLLTGVLAGQDAMLERLIAAVSRAHERETERIADSPDLQIVRSLLAGERVDLDGLNYTLAGWHLAAIVRGHRPLEAARRLGRELQCELLYAEAGVETGWIWLQARRRREIEEVRRALTRCAGDAPSIAVGEWAEGVAGWRLSHQQAQAALAVAIASRPPRPVVWYRESLPLAAIVRDETAVRTLRQMYLDPLEGAGGQATRLRETLRGYLAADKNLTAAAERLNVKRQTVTSRIREAESLVGRPLRDCHVELGLALELADLDLPQK